MTSRAKTYFSGLAKPFIRRNSGFSLVEVLVALLIGMIGLIIMLQVFAAAEGQKRTTTGAGDAQSSGAMAMYTLQRDIRQAGYGFNALSTLGCPLTLATNTLTNLAPIVINPPAADVPAGDANTDTLLITYGSSEGSPEGDAITMVAGTKLGVLTPTNFRVGHQVIAARSGAVLGCALTLSAVTAVAAPNITVPSSGAVEGGALFNLGAAPKILAYAVRSGNLTVCDYTVANCGEACVGGNPNCNANWVPIASNIASLRAQYGRDTSATMDGVDTWDQTTPAQPSPANQEVFACRWARASAVRLALVARNSQIDKDVITDLSPTWAGSADDPIVLGSAPSGGDPDPGWRHYRYKTFETAIPIRNLPWMASCT